ncbi:MAG TPA: SBBP repeat-containing protein [Acidimicrobiales bacterium]
MLARLPLGFETTESPLRFHARAVDYGVALDGGDATVALPSAVSAGEPTSTLQITLRGRNPEPVVQSRQPLASTTNYFLGDDPAHWRAGVSSFGVVAYQGVWPGVDAVWHGRQQQLEVDFVVAPGADAGAVAMHLGGADHLVVDREGKLVMTIGGREVRLDAPTLYQDGGDGRRRIDGAFDLRGPHDVGFRVGAHDPALPLVIDPVLVTATYLGGSGSDSAYGVAIDGDGNVYVTGSTESSDFPSEGPVQPHLVEANGIRTDAFVTKLNAAGTTLVYSTFLGGQGHDIGYGIAVGADDSPYVTGSTDSSDFPVAKPFKKNYGGGATDAFITKLGPQGAVIDYSTYLGGGGADIARGIALDQAGDAVVAGSTSSADFPTAKAVQGTLRKPDDTDAFVAKITPPGADVIYSTFLGGTGSDHALAVAVDGQGAAYVTGDTSSTDFPTSNPLQSQANGGGSASSATDVFITKLDPSGASLAYSTYLGGADADESAAIALDRDGSAYVTGKTSSANFPVVRPIQAKKNGDTDVFVSRLSSAGTALVFSTYLGGSGSDGGRGIVLDRLGRTSLTGATASNDFPVAKPFQATKSGGLTEAFVSTLGTDGSSLAFSSYLGGRDEDLGSAITADRDGNLYVAGYTNSTDFPTAKPFQAAKGGGVGDGFVAKVGDQSTKAAGGGSSTSPGRERRIQFLLAATIVLFGAAIGQTLWLRRRRIPTGSRPPAPQTAFGGMAVGRIEGDRFEPPPGVRRVAPVAPPVVDDDGEQAEAPLPLVAPVRPVVMPGPPEPTPPPDGPDLETQAAPVVEAPEPELDTRAVPVPDLLEPTPPEPAMADPALDDPALSGSWAEAPISDELWARPGAGGQPAPVPVEQVEPEEAEPPVDADIAVPDLLPEPEPLERNDDDVELWQMMTVEPPQPSVPETSGPAAAPPGAPPTPPAPPMPQSLSELLEDDVPIPERRPRDDEELSISDLLDEDLTLPEDRENGNV